MRRHVRWMTGVNVYCVYELWMGKKWISDSNRNEAIAVAECLAFPPSRGGCLRRKMLGRGESCWLGGRAGVEMMHATRNLQLLQPQPVGPLTYRSRPCPKQSVHSQYTRYIDCTRISKFSTPASQAPGKLFASRHYTFSCFSRYQARKRAYIAVPASLDYCMPRTPLNPLRRRSGATSSSSASPFRHAQRTKPGSGAASSSHKDATLTRAESGPRLDDVGGRQPSLAPRDHDPDDLVGLIRHILNGAFSEIPDRAAGMSSTRIAEVLNARAALPPVVSLAHLLALSSSPTKTERALAKLTAQGTVRKVVIPGRGKGGAAVGEGVVVTADWLARLDAEQGLDESTREKYRRLVASHPTSLSVSVAAFTPAELRDLVTIGFFTNPTALADGPAPSVFTGTGGTTFGNTPTSIATAGSSAVTGTLAAVGGAGAIHDSGGSGSTLATSDRRHSSSLMKQSRQQLMTLALPGTGAYLNLLVSARAHLCHLLRQISPRWKEALQSSLREKWEGNTLSSDLDAAKRARGEFGGVLPGKTKRWREFWGLRFEWVLAECIGCGMVELFETGGMGIGVRAR